MSKFTIPAAVLTVALTAIPAFASTTVSGTVEAWNHYNHELTLKDGQKFILNGTYVDASAFKMGDRVTITYNSDNGENLATDVMSVDEQTGAGA